MGYEHGKVYLHKDKSLAAKKSILYSSVGFDILVLAFVPFDSRLSLYTSIRGFLLARRKDS